MDAHLTKATRLPPRRYPLFSTWQWLTILGGLIITSVGLSSFAYSNFQTQKDADHFDSAIDKRLTRIEDKLDQLIFQRRK